MVKSAEVQKLFRDAIDEKNKNFGQWETVKKFELLAKEWSIDTGELTPTMKVKRKVVNERYLAVIEKLYNQA
jgi:long-chain acyl-CoA synthetase